jgi:POT family proton-dependent oligopeptide transporter
LADRYLGYRWAVVLGALAMTLGHASMAVETLVFIYIGGFLMWEWLFKPNMTSIISNAYHNILRKRRCLFNVLYGCECRCFFRDYALYIGEKISWLGFWISRRFMLFGMYSFTQDIFGDIGLKPTAASKQKSREKAAENTPVNVVRINYCRVNFFSLYSVLLGFV